MTDGIEEEYREVVELAEGFTTTSVVTVASDATDAVR